MIKVRAVFGMEGRDLWLDPREIAAVEESALAAAIQALGRVQGEPRPVTEVTLKGGTRFLVDCDAATFMAEMARGE
jgi:hypothetical protein